MMDSTVSSLYIPTVPRNCKKMSKSNGMTFLVRAMYVTRLVGLRSFDGEGDASGSEGLGTSNAARKGSVAYSERSRITMDGVPATDRSMVLIVSRTVTSIRRLVVSIENLYLRYVTVPGQESTRQRLGGN